MYAMYGMVNYKTMKCYYFQKDNYCKNGKACQFAHSDAELRTPIEMEYLTSLANTINYQVSNAAAYNAYNQDQMYNQHYSMGNEINQYSYPSYDYQNGYDYSYTPDTNYGEDNTTNNINSESNQNLNNDQMFMYNYNYANYFPTYEQQGYSNYINPNENPNLQTESLQSQPSQSNIVKENICQSDDKTEPKNNPKKKMNINLSNNN